MEHPFVGEGKQRRAIIRESFLSWRNTEDLTFVSSGIAEPNKCLISFRDHFLNLVREVRKRSADIPARQLSGGGSVLDCNRGWRGAYAEPAA
jgi:hypothetical protein